MAQSNSGIGILVGMLGLITIVVLIAAFIKYYDERKKALEHRP
jgi:hypothetical protein